MTKNVKGLASVVPRLKGTGCWIWSKKQDSVPLGCHSQSAPARFIYCLLPLERPVHCRLSPGEHPAAPLELPHTSTWVQELASCLRSVIWDVRGWTNAYVRSTWVEGLIICPLHVHLESLSVGLTSFWGFTFISLDHHQLTQYLLVYSSQWDTISLMAPVSQCLLFTPKDWSSCQPRDTLWTWKLPDSENHGFRIAPEAPQGGLHSGLNPGLVNWPCLAASCDLAPAELCPGASLSSALTTPLVLLPCLSNLLILVLLLVLCAS